MRAEEFLKLSKEEQNALIAQVEKINKGVEKIVEAEVGQEKLTMNQFEEKMNSILEKFIKGMTPVDKKHFMFPGIGDDAKMADDLSGAGKYAKTKKFFQALVGKDAKVLNAMHMDVATKANLSEGTTTAGGFLVPEEFKAEILRLQPLYGVLRSNVRILPMAYDIVNIPVANQEVTASWVNEASQITSTDPTFRQVTLTINKLASIPQVSNELLADANVSVIEFLAMTIAEQFAKEEDRQGFNGTGAPFVGALVATGVPNVQTVGTAAVGMSYSDLANITGKLYSNAKANAKFYFHRSMIARINGLITTAGAPIFGQSVNSIFGYPVVDTEILPTDSAATGTNYAVFGDLRRGMIMGERGSMTMKITEEGTVGGNNLFEKDMAALRVIERVTMGVVLPSSFLTIKG